MSEGCATAVLPPSSVDFYSARTESECEERVVKECECVRAECGENEIRKKRRRSVGRSKGARRAKDTFGANEQKARRERARERVMVQRTADVSIVRAARTHTHTLSYEIICITPRSTHSLTRWLTS